MDYTELKFRCIEAASRAPIAHHNGPAAGVQEVASAWFNWITSDERKQTGPSTLHLPKKDKN